MAFDRYLLDDIREQVPLESVALSSSLFVRHLKTQGLCPFHSEKTPSLC